MKNQTLQDIKQLSAYLDRQLPSVEAARLESRLKTNKDLASVLLDLHHACTLLGRSPQRRAPRNFTLTPVMAGIRPPMPRAVSAFSWASAVTMVLFIFTLGASLLKGLPFGAAAPMMVEAPVGMSAFNSTDQAADEGDTLEPVTPENNLVPTPVTPDLKNPPAVEPGSRSQQPEATMPWAFGWMISWSFLWLVLALLFIVLALVLRWITWQAFKRRLK